MALPSYSAGESLHNADSNYSDTSSNFRSKYAHQSHSALKARSVTSATLPSVIVVLVTLGNVLVLSDTRCSAVIVIL